VRGGFLGLPRAPGGVKTCWLGWQFLNGLHFLKPWYFDYECGFSQPYLERQHLARARNNAGRLGAGCISVCLETRWLGQKRGFLCPGMLLYLLKGRG